MWTLRQILIGVRFAWFQILCLVITSLGSSIWLVVSALGDLVRRLGVAENLAKRWHAEALTHGFPPIWEIHLLNVFRVLAMFTILGGWFFLLLIEYLAFDYVIQWLFHS